ncbi:hypothetical protein KC19_10G111300 [Ceratodon purpureus]|uniref:Uncharacterized protein n=1 Tax=Ceratodon purpureus TaxID=3225 RepID=A0A8T0GLS1_CERPU|nr:hypothetical protein KC19_10G111300 [Ceratodon purpureus]
MEWKGGIVATIGASLALAVELTGNQHPCTCSSVDGEGDGGRVMVVPMVPMVLMAFSSFACIRPLSSSISVPLLGCSGMHHQPWPGLAWAGPSLAGRPTWPSPSISHYTCRVATSIPAKTSSSSSTAPPTLL